MSELDPVYHSPQLDALRAKRLSPHVVRLLLWSAGGRVMVDPTFTEYRLKRAGIYLGAVLDAVAAIELGDAAFMASGAGSLSSLLDMGYMMAWAAREVRTAEFASTYNPLSSEHQERAMHMRLTIGGIEDHLACAYEQHLAYQEACQADPAQTDVNWH